MLSINKGVFNKSVLIEVLSGYAIQLLTVGLLLAQNLVLPQLVGLEEYGKLTYLLASSALLYAFYDHGYNLMIIRKKSLYFYFIFCKLEIFLGFGAFYVAFWLFTGFEQVLHPLLVVPHAFSMMVFTSIIYFFLAGNKARKTAIISIILAVFGLLTPVLFFYIAVPIVLAPLVSTTTTLVIVVFFWSDKSLKVISHNVSKFVIKKMGFAHRWKLFLKQAYISAGTIIDGLIVWSGVYFFAILHGPYEAAVFRISMSIIALMGLAIPFFKPSFLKLSRNLPNFLQLSIVSLLVVFFLGFLQWLFVLFFGMPILLVLFAQDASGIFNVVMTLVLVPAFKVLIEFQTILFDRRNCLNYQLWSAAVALPITFGYAWKYQSIEAILIFYFIMCLSNIVFLFYLFRPASPTF